MNGHTDPQIITDSTGQPAFAVIPYNDYLKLVEDEAKVDKLTIPHDVVAATVAGSSPIKAWREYLGLTQAELAARAGISQPALAKFEKAEANLRRGSLKKIAAALDIDIAQLDI